MSETYYKFLGEDGLTRYAKFAWPLPAGDKPGEWVEVEGELSECEVGLHACTEEYLLMWINTQLYVLEYDGEVHTTGAKVYGRRARLMRYIASWNAQTARLFAADCAEHVSQLWVAPDGCDWDPAQTIRVVRQFALGMVGHDAINAAWYAAVAAASVTRAASRAASGAAASAAASAARSAASDAAWSAASAAASAAWSTASDASDAASADERHWQISRLMEYIRGEVDIEAIRRSVGEAEDE